LTARIRGFAIMATTNRFLPGGVSTASAPAVRLPTGKVTRRRQRDNRNAVYARNLFAEQECQRPGHDLSPRHPGRTVVSIA
jgi:hypothetical protein